MKFSPRSLVAVISCAVLVTACSSNSTSEDVQSNAKTLTVATAFYPMTEIVSRVTTGTDVDIVSLTPPGIGAHDHQLTAQQLDELSDADAVFYLGGGIQPTVEKAVTQLPTSTATIDLLDSVTTLAAEKETDHDDHGGEEQHSDEESHSGEKTTEDDHAHGDVDPHVWLDPANMVLMTQTVLSTLSELSPDNQAAFDANATAYIDELTTLGDELDAAFATCESRALVTSHDAFGYFAARAKLDTVPIAGVNPENEPSVKELEEIAEIAKDAEATTVFFEALLPDGLAKTVASSIQADVDVIDPIETLSASALSNGEDYLTVQRQNIQKISQGLRCS